ncbi:MAG: Ribosomal protein [Candidatus Kaiserbacteria bacterium]|nr:Ribosomal protein [Candidatus Kaiserbacteria bacterium]
MNETVTTQDTDLDEGPLPRIYEIGYHIVPIVKEEDIETVVSTIRGSIERSGGTFISEGAPVNIRLSYPMSVHKRGKNVDYDRSYFGWIKFEALPETARVLEDILNRDPEILRSIVFRTIREDTRAHIKTAPLRDIKRTDTLKTVQRTEESAPVSEADINKAIEELTTE